MDSEIQKNEFMSRIKYTEFTVEVLNGIPDDKIEQAIIDYIFEEVIGDDWEKEYDKVKSLSLGFQYVFATWTLEGEVNNGGFNQYFNNSTGQFAEEAYNGYLAFGSKEMAENVNGAVECLFDEFELFKKTKAADTLEAFMESYEESELDIWDDKFYDCSDDLSKLRLKYIRENIKEFVTN